jgi:hypothetical protein
LIRRVAKRVTRSASGVGSSEITIADDGYYGAPYHEAASKFFGQKLFRLDIHQAMPRRP